MKINLLFLNEIIDKLTSVEAIRIYIIIFAALVILLGIAFLITNNLRKGRQIILPSGNMVSSKAGSLGNSSTSSISSDEVEETSISRFPTLYSIDEKYPKIRRVNSPANMTLKGICSRFREYASGTLKRYYQIKDIRAFIASMASSKIILLQGMSGTGKTSLPVAFGQFISLNTPVIPVQPTWKERSDLLGYYNEFTGKFSETPLLSALYEAGTTDSIKLIVLDEANIARIEYYFAEFLSLLELPNPKSRKLQVATSYMEHDPKRIEEGVLLLPENVWFICTANNDDSTFAISDKVYDRTSVIDLDTRAEAFASDPGTKMDISYPRLLKLFNEASRRYQLSERDTRRIKELDNYLKKVFKVSFGNRIMRQIQTFVPVYVACGGKALEAIDLMLSKKVIRKLSACNPVYVKSRSEDLISEMKELFGEENVTDCIDAIRRIADNG